MAIVYRYIIHILIAIDQLVTTIFGGWPDETISSYVYRLYWKKKLAGLILLPIINKIFFWHKNHCRSSYMAERSRTQLPPILR